MVLKGSYRNTIFYEYIFTSSVYVIEILSPLTLGMSILPKKIYFREKIKNFFQRVSDFFPEIADNFPNQTKIEKIVSKGGGNLSIFSFYYCLIYKITPPLGAMILLNISPWFNYIYFSGKDSPSSKLLFAKDIPLYRQLVIDYYKNIQHLPQVSHLDN